MKQDKSEVTTISDWPFQVTSTFRKIPSTIRTLPSNEIICGPYKSHIESYHLASNQIIEVAEIRTRICEMSQCDPKLVEFLKYIVDGCMQKLRALDPNVTKTDIVWCVTHPLNWNTQQKGNLLEICQQSGMIKTVTSNQLVLIPDIDAIDYGLSADLDDVDDDVLVADSGARETRVYRRRRAANRFESECYKVAVGTYNLDMAFIEYLDTLFGP